MKPLPVILALILTVSNVQAHEWVDLFDGKTLKGWEAQGDVNWAVKDGAITADRGEVSLLTTKDKYQNYELELEFRAAIDANSGVFMNSEPVITDEATDCYEVNIAPQSNPFPTGSIVKFIKIEGQEERDEWRSYQLSVNGNTITVGLDGKKLYELSVQNPRPAGYIGLQFNRGNIAFRNIRLKELH